MEARGNGTRHSQGDADLNPPTIAAHTKLLRNKPTQPTHPPPTPMPVRLKCEKGHVPSTRVTRRLPTTLRFPTVEDPKGNEGTRAEAPSLLPDPTKLFVHRDVAIAASEELGPEG